jgi:hypothetical protein
LAERGATSTMQTTAGRIAAPASYVLNLGAASELGFDVGDVQGVLAAIAPIVGTARIATATGNIVRAHGFALETAALDEDE